eukprot:760593-Hanusia_phi.AAC.6
MHDALQLTRRTSRSNHCAQTTCHGHHRPPGGPDRASSALRHEGSPSTPKLAMRAQSRKRTDVLWLIAALSSALFACVFWHLDVIEPTKPAHKEEIGVYQLANGVNEPNHLSLIPSRYLFPNGSMPIHQAHTLGLPHRGKFCVHDCERALTMASGVWIHLVDKDGKILVLKRTSALKTCPGKWGCVGEHQKEGEDPKTLVDRALLEELGTNFRDKVKRHTNITSNPVWYFRQYNDGRRDRQLTWMWLVQLKDAASRVTIYPDAEVDEYKWVPIKELIRWIETTDSDFCHETVTSLMKFGLNRLLEVLQM